MLLLRSTLGHSLDAYADRAVGILRDYMGDAFFFFRQEVIEVQELLTALLITYDGVKDDSREVSDKASPEGFLQRMSKAKKDWAFFDLDLVRKMAPHQVLGGWEGRTIYFIKPGTCPEQWSGEKATEDVTNLLNASGRTLGRLIQIEAENLRDIVPVGREHFQGYERMVRVMFNFLFRGELGEGRAQVRTEPENEGVEIRDLLFANRADFGFWKDLKTKYSASEIVVDAKNTDAVDRGDLRQLYCYLKPALGYWGFIVCRSPQPESVQAFNRTLYKNFRQERGILVLSDDDLRRMVLVKNGGNSPTAYLQERMSEFLRSV